MEQTVGVRARLVAFLIDAVLLLAFTGPILFLVYGPEYFDPSGSFTWVHGFWDLVLSYILPPGLLLFFWAWKGATPGKLALSIRIVDAGTGEQPSFRQFLLRLLGYALSALPLGAGFLWIAFDARKQGLHDRLARTLVVDPMASEPEPVEPEGGEEALETQAPVGAASPLRLALFRVGATALLLTGAAAAVHRLMRATSRTAATGATTEPSHETEILTPVVETVLPYIHSATALLSVGLGLLLVWRAARRPEARVLALLLGFFFFRTSVLAPLGIDEDAGRLLERVADWLALAALIRFVTIFPRTVTRAELGRSAGTRPAILLLSPVPIWTTAALIPLTLHHLPALDRVLGPPIMLVVTGLLLVAMWLLRLNLNGASARERGRGLWVVYGFLLAIGTPVALGILGIATTIGLKLAAEIGAAVPAVGGYEIGHLIGTVAAVISPLILTATLAFAVLYRGAIDASLAIRKTTLYGLLGILAMTVFALVEYVLSTQLSRLIELPDAITGILSAGLSTAVAGLARRRVGRRTDSVIDRFLAYPAGGAPPSPRGRVTVLAVELGIGADAGTIPPRDLLALSAALRRHARRLAETRRGRPLDAVADALLLEFEDANDAAATAFALEQAIAEETRSRDVSGIGVAAGVHVAVLDRNAAGEAIGPALDRVLRLLRLAHPLGIVISEETADSMLAGDDTALEPVDRGDPGASAAFRLERRVPA